MAPSCPFCSATAPALNRFDEEYRGRGLVLIGVYHHKDPEPLDVETVRGYIAHYQFRFPVAVDPDWQTLKRWWLDRPRALVDERQLPHRSARRDPSRALGRQAGARHRRLPRHAREDRGVARGGSLAS
jgi:thiol-disulfide isomerase/thioredoxin